MISFIVRQRVRLIVSTLALSGLTGLAACTSPEPRYFVLTETASPPPQASVLPLSQATVAVRKVALAAYLDRPEIVKEADGVRVHVSTRDNWAEPLQDMLTRIVTADLGHVLPNARIVPENGAVAVPVQATVQINIVKFDREGGQVVLQAQAAIIWRRDGGDITRSIDVVDNAPVSGKGSGPTVDAMSVLLGRLASRIAAMAQ